MLAEEYKEALLENQKYHEGCPGCKVEMMKQLRRGYPTSSFPSFAWSERRLDAAFLRGSHMVFFFLNVNCRGRRSSHVQAISNHG
ncbi:unnamed protein product [Arabis nemorensis]|uniref:Uncharacterized protein n=1 Tax=Arabis nemorensis TaxID=586526 RepID=A0A565CLI9_9BRAS|nr:unnamed protein product [Arabis nemorensis]